MSGFCPNADQLAVLVTRPVGDPFWAHADTCPDCRARLQAYRRFLAPEEGGEDLDFDLEEADGELAGQLSAALAGPEGLPDARSRWRSPRLFYGLAAALLVGVGLFVAPELTGPQLGQPPAPGGVLRGDDHADGMYVISAEGDRWQFTWPVHPEADRAVAVFFDQALNQVALAAADSPHGLTLDRPDTGSPVAFVQILFLAQGDTLARGPLLQTPLSPTPLPGR